MSASIGAAALFIFTLGLEQFAIPGFLGSHIRLDTLAYAIYQRTNAYPNDLPGAAAAGTLLLGLAALGLYFYRRLIRRSERFVTVTARGYKPAPTALGRLRYPVAIFATLIFVVGSLLPLCAVLLRALMPVRTASVDLSSLGFGNFESLWRAVDIRLGVFNSLWLADGAATLCAALGFVLALAVVRRPDSRPIIVADYLIAMPSSPATLECRVIHFFELHDLDGAATGRHVVVGQVVGVHLDDRFIVGGRFDARLAPTIARCGYDDYLATTDLFQMPRPMTPGRPKG